MQLNRQHRSSGSGPRQSQNVDQFIDGIVNDFRPRLEKQRIVLETDLDSVDACVDSALLHSAASALVENAIQSMPNGGEISITLIDGQHQWELEVADSLGMAFNPAEQSTKDSESDLPVIIPFPETENLRNAHRAALQHGGHIQTWSCPQGGTAHVLVVPRTPRNAPAAPAQHQRTNPSHD